MKSDGEIMKMLDHYDLTGSFRATGLLVGCSHNTVKSAVEARAAGAPPTLRRTQLIDDYRQHLENWVEDSRGKIRGDVVHNKLVALGYTGSDRTTRRALAETKRQWRQGNTRVPRPWVPETGLWLQYDSVMAPPSMAARSFSLWLGWRGVDTV